MLYFYQTKYVPIALYTILVRYTILAALHLAPWRVFHISLSFLFVKYLYIMLRSIFHSSNEVKWALKLLQRKIDNTNIFSVIKMAILKQLFNLFIGNHFKMTFKKQGLFLVSMNH